jgi:hypothetical protein
MAGAADTPSVTAAASTANVKMVKLGVRDIFINGLSSVGDPRSKALSARLGVNRMGTGLLQFR